jgi:hypothetical protein
MLTVGVGPTAKPALPHASKSSIKGATGDRNAAASAPIPGRALRLTSSDMAWAVIGDPSNSTAGGKHGSTRTPWQGLRVRAPKDDPKANISSRASAATSTCTYRVRRGRPGSSRGLRSAAGGARAWWSPTYPIRLPGTNSDQRVRTARPTARQVPVKGRVHKARVVHGDQQAQAAKRVGGRRPGCGRAGGTEVGGVQNGVREDRRREESSRSTTAGHRDACHERTGCHRRRCQARDRLPVPYRRESLPQGGTARTRNDGDVHARVEVADRPPMIVRPRASHNEEYGAPQTREALPERADIAAEAARRSPARSGLAVNTMFPCPR